MKTILPKFKFKSTGIVINAPAALEKEFIKLGLGNAFDKKSKSENTVVFVNNSKELLDFLNKQLKNIEYDSVLWLAYPKGTSKIKTDINRDSIWKTANEFGWDAVSAISIDDTWSGLRLRPLEKVGKK
jgi:hypothetical protein